MNVETMSKDRERQIFGAIHDVIKMANAGIDPSTAMAKVATSNAFTPDVVERMCNAFNTSKTLALIHDATGSEKLATFDVADPSKVIEIMYPKKVQTPKQAAVSSWIPNEGLEPETRSFHLKAAESCGCDGTTDSSGMETENTSKIKKLYRVREEARRAAKQAELDIISARTEAFDALQKFANYFRELSAVSFSDVDATVQGHWGLSGKSLMSATHALTKQAGFNFKRASSVRPTFAPRSGPYELARQALERRNELVYAQQKSANASANLKRVEKDVSSILEKLADAGDTLANVLLLDRIQEATGADTTPMSEHVTRATEEIMDPAYEAQRRGLRAQVMLSDLMETDPVISKHPKPQIISAYNRVASTYPNLADSEIALQTYLRRLLEGGEVDPNDLATASDIESSMAKNPAVGPGEGARAIATV